MSVFNLTKKQYRAIEALIEAGEVNAAARIAGIDRKSFYRWFGQPEFAAALQFARAAAYEAWLAGLLGKEYERGRALNQLPNALEKRTRWRQGRERFLFKRERRAQPGAPRCSDCGAEEYKPHHNNCPQFISVFETFRV